MIQTIFGFVDKDGCRKYKEAFTLIGRKNGKSSLLAAIGLYMLMADGEGGSEVYPVANKRDRANIYDLMKQSMASRQHFLLIDNYCFWADSVCDRAGEIT